MASLIASTARAQTPPTLSWSTPAVTAQPGRPLAPVLGARTASPRVRFAWAPLGPDDERTLELSRVGDTHEGTLRVRVRGDGVTLDRPLAVGTWRWRLLADGADGGATELRSFRVSAGHGPANVAWGFAGDDDGDGVFDVAFAVPDGNALRGGAIPLPWFDGPERAASERWHVDGSAPRSPIGDLDGDGVDDAVVLRVAHDRSTVTFETTRAPRDAFRLDVPRGARLWSLYPVGDLDRDGRADLAGTLAFDDRTWPFVLTAAGGARVLPPLGDGSRTVRSLDAGDVDADGLHDVAYVTRSDGNGPPCVRVVFGGALSSPRQSERCFTEDGGWEPTGEAAAGDFDGDGASELALVAVSRRTGERDVIVFRGSATPFAAPPSFSRSRTDVASPRPTERFGAALAFADVDGDGRDELWVGDPGDANGCGCVRVFTEGRLDATRVCGNDDRAPVGATLRAIGAPRDDGRAWVSTAATTMPDAQESYGWVIGGDPLRVRAMVRPRRAHGAPLLRVTPVLEPLAPGPAEQIDAVLRRDAEALATLRRSRPRLALAAAMIAASDARDVAALRRLDAALAAVPALDEDYLHIEGDTPLARAFDAMRVGMLTEVGDGFVPPASLCRALVAHATPGVQRFHDRWGSGQSGPSEGARGACLRPLVTEMIGDDTRGDVVYDAATALRGAHLRMFAPPAIGVGGSMELGFAMQPVDRIDEYLFGVMPAGVPSAQRLAAAERRLDRAAAQRRSSFGHLDEAVRAWRAGVDARVSEAAALACASRRVRGESDDIAACTAWGRVVVREALAAWIAHAWTTVESGNPEVVFPTARVDLW